MGFVRNEGEHVDRAEDAAGTQRSAQSALLVEEGKQVGTFIASRQFAPGME